MIRKMAESEKFATVYKRFRSGRMFFVTLLTFISAWIFLHVFDKFDPDWGLLNLVLSVEAALAMSLFMMLSEKQDEIQRNQDEMQQKQLIYMQHLLEVTVELLEHEKKNEEIKASLDKSPKI